MKCPFCNEEVEAFKGDCKHCGKNLNAEGFRQMLEAREETQKQLEGELADQKKINEANVTRIAVMEEKMKEQIEAAVNDDPEANKRPKPVKLMNVVRMLMTDGKAKGCEYEREVFEQESEKIDAMRALSTGAVGTGGAIVPPEYLGVELIELLRANIVLEKLGARVLNGLTGSPVLIPKLSGGATAFDVAENAAKTATDQTFQELNLVPTEVAAATIYSKRMALLSNPSVDNLINEDLMLALAERIDLLGFTGTGAASQPVGIINVAGVGTYTLDADVGNGAVPIPVDVDDSQLVLQEANAFRGNLGWASSPRTFNTFKKMRDESGGAGTDTGGWLFRQDIKEGNLDGVKFEMTTQIPNNVVKGGSADTTHLILGNYADLILAFWGGLELATSDQAEGTFLKNQIIIKASMLYDIAVRHEASFVVIDGVRA